MCTCGCGQPARDARTLYNSLFDELGYGDAAAARLM